MIFPFYRDSRMSYDRKMADYTVPIDHNFIRTKRQTTQVSSSSPKQHSSSEALEWLKKKSGKHEHTHKFNSQNSSRKKNYCQLPLTKFFMRRKSFIDPKQTQQPTLFKKQKQKRFHSESQYLQNKRKLVFQDKSFNQNFIDTQHNFTGKNYRKQIQNTKIVSPNKPESKFKLFLSTTLNSGHQQKKNSFIFQKSYKPQEKSQNLIIKKKLSLSDKFEIKKSNAFVQQTQTVPSKVESINAQLRKQIQKNVKDDIKAEILKFKKYKLNKFKFKQNRALNQQKNLMISQDENLQVRNQQNEEYPQKNTQKFLTQYNCEMKFRGKKVVKVVKTSHSSFSWDQIEQTIISPKKVPISIYQNLQPWQGQSSQFYGFR